VANKPPVGREGVASADEVVELNEDARRTAVPAPPAVVAVVPLVVDDEADDDAAAPPEAVVSLATVTGGGTKGAPARNCARAMAATVRASSSGRPPLPVETVAGVGNNTSSDEAEDEEEDPPPPVPLLTEAGTAAPSSPGAISLDVAAAFPLLLLDAGVLTAKPLR
jgi:hypothetical protein